ncbi:MAG: hypothetical protein CMJ18_00600 [Phycisphaeraceae bacterium]|nr:hypothetical protein [Phycisphaeraceae bacterium]
MCLVVAWCAFAGPMLPKRNLPDDHLSVSGLSQFTIEAFPTQQVMDRYAVSDEKLASVFRERLEQKGFRVHHDGNHPRLRLTVFDAQDTDQPDAVALTAVISVYQKVFMDRLDRQMTLPTITFGMTSLTTKDNVADTLKQLIWDTSDALAGTVHTASKQ